MTAGPSIEPARFWHEQMEAASPDLLRHLLSTFIDALMGAEADAICGAEYGTRTSERVNTRNGYRHRDFDTRVGTMDVAIPKLRAGTYFPDWLLERRRRAEAALTSVVATCYLLGVSTRRMDKLVESLGITRLSKSQVSRMAADLDEQVTAFRTRPLDAGPYTFCAADALAVKVREGGRVVNIAAMVATGVNADGHREILGIDVSTAEDGAGWLTFFRDLTARGLSGVKLVTSDAHSGLVAAIGATLPGSSWQRCRTHYAANLMSACPKSSCPPARSPPGPGSRPCCTRSRWCRTGRHGRITVAGGRCRRHDAPRGSSASPPSQRSHALDQKVPAVEVEDGQAWIPHRSVPGRSRHLNELDWR